MRYQVQVLGVTTAALLLTVLYPAEFLVREHGAWECAQVLFLATGVVGAVIRTRQVTTAAWPLWFLTFAMAFAVGEEVQWGASLWMDTGIASDYGVHEQHVGQVDLNRMASWLLHSFTAVFLIFVPVVAHFRPYRVRWICQYGWPIPSWRLVPFAGFAMVAPLAGLGAGEWSASEIQETLVYLILCVAIWSPLELMASDADLVG